MHASGFVVSVVMYTVSGYLLVRAVTCSMFKLVFHQVKVSISTVQYGVDLETAGLGAKQANKLDSPDEITTIAGEIGGKENASADLDLDLERDDCCFDMDDFSGRRYPIR